MRWPPDEPVAPLPRLVGGHLCLDFVNTIDPRHAEHPTEHLASYEALLAWAVHASAIDPEAGARLAGDAARHEAAAGRVLATAVALRESLYRLLAPGAPGPGDADVARVNAAIGDALRHRRLDPDAQGRWRRRWSDVEAPERLALPLWPVAEAAEDLLVRLPTGRLRECEGHDGCGWLFLDTSKSGRRRWCTMEGCGNRAKARRHRERRRPRGA